MVRDSHCSGTTRPSGPTFLRATRTHSCSTARAQRASKPEPNGRPTHRPRVRSPAGHRRHNVAASGAVATSRACAKRGASVQAKASCPDRRGLLQAMRLPVRHPTAEALARLARGRTLARAPCGNSVPLPTSRQVAWNRAADQARPKERAKQAGPPSRQPRNCAPQLQPRATRGPQLPSLIFSSRSAPLFVCSHGHGQAGGGKAMKGDWLYPV